MFRATLALLVSLLVNVSFGDSLIATIPDKESNPKSKAAAPPHDEGGAKSKDDAKKGPRELSEGELEKFRRRVTEMWEEKGYARDREPGERPIYMNKELAAAIREAHEGKPELLHSLLDELRAQITDKKECEDFFSNFRQAYLKSENYAKARSVLDMRAISTMDLQEKIKKGDKEARAEYDRRVNAIVSVGNGIWSTRQTSNLLFAYSDAVKKEADLKANGGGEPSADARLEYMLGYLQPGVERGNQIRFVEDLQKKDSLPCGENLNKDMADAMKVLRAKEAGHMSLRDEIDLRTGKRDPNHKARLKEWEDLKAAERTVPKDIQEAMARRFSPNRKPEYADQIEGPRGYQDNINHVVDTEGPEYEKMKEKSRADMFKWFADESKRYYRPTLNEYLSKLQTQLGRNGRTRKDTMTEAEGELVSTIDMLAAVDPMTGARSMKVDGKRVDLAPPFDRFGEKPTESDIPRVAGIDWSKSKVEIPRYELTLPPPETAEQNRKLFAMQMENGKMMPAEDQKAFLSQIKQYWDDRAASYTERYKAQPPAGMFPKVPLYKSPQDLQSEAQSSQIQSLETQLAAERAAAKKREEEQNARFERLERLLQQQQGQKP